MSRILPIDKLLDVETEQYKIAVAAFKRVKQIAGNDKLRSRVSDSKRFPVAALASVLNEEVEIVEFTEEQMKMNAEKRANMGLVDKKSGRDKDRKDKHVKKYDASDLFDFTEPQEKKGRRRTKNVGNDKKKKEQQGSFDFSDLDDQE